MWAMVWVLVTAVMAQGASVLAPDAKLEKLTDTCQFTEGPTSDPAGNVYFTDQPTDRILRYSVEGQLSVWKSPCGRANGLCFDAAGSLWVCADERNELWCLDPTGKAEVVVRGFDGKLLNGPNDVWAAPGGGIYFTDPYYKRGYWQRGPKEQGEHVYYLAPDHKTVTRVADDLRQPNGIIGTADGKTLYVADIGAGKTWRYTMAADGSLTGKTQFCAMGSDGMTLDAEGNVYLTGKGVTVFDKDGQELEKIAVPEGWTANACFGGKDHRELFITAGKCLYRIATRVAGAGSQ